MARFRQVTRTIEFTEADVLYINTETEETWMEKVKISGTFDSTEDVLSELVKNATGNIKPVVVKSAVTGADTYCMPEEKFMEYAMVLPENKKTLTKADYKEFYENQE